MQSECDSLPKSWRWLSVQQVCTLINGDAYKDSDWSKSGTPIIRIQNLNDETKPFNYWAGRLDDRVRVSSGDLLFAWSGTPGTSFGAHIWERGDGVLNQHIFRVDENSELVERSWLSAALNHALEEIIDKSHGGVGLRHITKPKLEQVLLPIPPIEEQRRIVAALNEQQAALRASRSFVSAQLTELARLAAANDSSLFPSEIDAPADWRRLSFDDAFQDVTNMAGKLATSEFKANGAIPIVDQGETEISGWSDRRDLAYHGPLPVIVFGDHTRLVKLMSKPFIKGADGVRLFVPRTGIDPHFAYHRLRTTRVEAQGYSRHMRILVKKVFPVPDLQRQHKLCATWSDRSKTINALNIVLQAQRDEIVALDSALLRAAFSGDL